MSLPITACPPVLVPPPYGGGGTSPPPYHQGLEKTLMIDGVMQSLGMIYTQKFQKAGMSILGDAKSYYVKNSSVNSVIIYIYMNILKMNFWIFLH